MRAAAALLSIVAAACSSSALPHPDDVAEQLDAGQLEQLADLSTPAPRDASSCSGGPVPPCAEHPSSIKACLDDAGQGIMLALPAETAGGTYGPPSLCTLATGITAAGFCQQDPTDVPAGYPYLLVTDCAKCAACRRQP